MTTKQININEIVSIDDDTLGVICETKEDATEVLKRNSMAQVMEQPNGTYVLLYKQENIDFKRAVLKR